MLESKEVSFRYKKFQLENVSLKLNEGYMTVLLGQNGAGKSTLMQLMYGLLKPKKGVVLWNGEKVKRRNLHLFRQEAAFVEAESTAIPGLSVLEHKQMLEPLYPNFVQEVYVSLLQRFRLQEMRLHEEYHAFSTGEKMALALAFALARSPKYLLLDEPFANVDPVIKADMLQVLQESMAENGMSVLISTHQVEDVTDIADYAAVLREGKLVTFGDREELFERYGTERLRELI